jgi:hypothetical protein
MTPLKDYYREVSASIEYPVKLEKLPLVRRFDITSG